MSQSSQYSLLQQRRFAPFFWTQFLGAGNDNVFKFAFTILVTFHTAEFSGVDPRMAVFLIGAIFIAPYVLFSATSGQLADKYEKSRLIRLVKSLEIVIMLVASYGFIAHNVWFLFAGTFLMGLHSTLFGPVKYAYLPQHLAESELVGGNGMVEMGTFVSILLGTMLGGTLAAIPETGPVIVATACICIAVLGRIASSFVPESPSAVPELRINWNPFTETWNNLKIGKQNRAVFLSMLGISWLWFFGAVFLNSFAVYSKDVMGGDEAVVTLMLAVFSVGIGIGSMLCERLSGHKVEIGLVPFGAIGMSVFAADLYFATPAAPLATMMDVSAFLAHRESIHVLIDLFLLAMFGGFFSVPLYALIQTRCEPSHRARIIAANNILNAIFLIASSLMGGFLLKAGLSIAQLFLVTAVLNAAVAIYIFTLVPEFLMRFLIWMLMHSIYRLKVVGEENIPLTGPAVIVCNHVSFVDALVIAAACPHPVRFVMDHNIFKIPLLGFIFRTARTIPIAPAKEDQKMLDAAYEAIAAGLNDGDVIAIFPEGRLTDNGEMYPFKGGISRIVQRTPVPVVPSALQGLWESVFSRKRGGKLGRLISRSVLAQVTFLVGPAVPPDQATPELLQEKVAALRGDKQ
jgi:1-acyl-sn-glycerol-3-phosphate acyltransferase